MVTYTQATLDLVTLEQLEATQDANQDRPRRCEDDGCCRGEDVSRAGPDFNVVWCGEGCCASYQECPCASS